MPVASLLIGYTILGFIAITMVVYPVRKHKKLLAVLVPVLIIMVVLSYGRWGYLTPLTEYLRVQAILKSIHTPKDILDRLKVAVEKHPQNPKGWYLLGKLYLNQGQPQQAEEAFNKYHQLIATQIVKEQE